jgi:hypothetical protein
METGGEVPSMYDDALVTTTAGGPADRSVNVFC